MALKKLDKKEQEVISRKITELIELDKKAITGDAKAYQYDWKQLDVFLNQAILEYKHILNTSECSS